MQESLPCYIVFVSNTTKFCFLLKRGRAICRLVREHVIRHDQGLLFFKGGASFGMSSGENNGQTDRQAEQFTSSNLVFDLI
jgi:hypothetical protein